MDGQTAELSTLKQSWQNSVSKSFDSTAWRKSVGWFTYRFEVLAANSEEYLDRNAFIAVYRSSSPRETLPLGGGKGTKGKNLKAGLEAAFSHRHNGCSFSAQQLPLRRRNGVQPCAGYPWKEAKNAVLQQQTRSRTSNKEPMAQDMRRTDASCTKGEKHDAEKADRKDDEDEEEEDEEGEEQEQEQEESLNAGKKAPEKVPRKEENEDLDEDGTADKAAPLRKKRSRSGDKPWLTKREIEILLMLVADLPDSVSNDDALELATMIANSARRFKVFAAVLAALNAGSRALLSPLLDR
jgi:hypothetical protein